MMRGRRGSLLSVLFLSSLLLGCDLEPVKTGKAKPTPTAPGPVDADAPEEFTTTESGLKYRIRRKTDGKKPTRTDMVTVNYRGWLDSGEIFDSTYGTGGYPNSMDLKTVIPAWTEGVQLIGEGAMIELEVPSELGYGDRGSPPAIPPKANLHFVIELVKVLDPPKPSEVGSPMSRPGPPGPPGLEPGPVDSDAPVEFTTTTSGLKYRIRRKSDGKTPTAESKVKVHYRGWLDNGDVFDSSYAKREPTEFLLVKVIKGWTEGLQLVGVGGMIELEVPSDLGYGPSGNTGIPPNATLHFLVELLEIR